MKTPESDSLTIEAMLRRKFTPKGPTKIITSLNRFERKKGIELALKAFAENFPEEENNDAILVIAGGCDERIFD